MDEKLIPIKYIGKMGGNFDTGRAPGNQWIAWIVNMGALISIYVEVPIHCPCA